MLLYNQKLESGFDYIRIELESLEKDNELYNLASLSREKPKAMVIAYVRYCKLV